MKRKQAIDSPIKDKGGKVTHNKTSEVNMERVCAHIDSFPAMEPHYTRKKFQLHIQSNSCSSRATCAHISGCCVCSDYVVLNTRR